MVGIPDDGCMVRLMTVLVSDLDDRVAITAYGSRRTDLRRAALRECHRQCGNDNWRICSETFCPYMTSSGGRVRLWQGQFELERGYN
jgi:hypothetical protein